jgi:hypothetical protein
MEDFSKLYEYQTRGFGNWCEDNVFGLSENFVDPYDVDKNYDGSSYDAAYVKGNKYLRVEIKGSRARKINYKSYSLLDKIATPDDEYEFEFLQIKPYCADVFIFIIVWKYDIRYYAFSSKEVEKLKAYSPHQHRGNKDEGQIHFTNSTIKELEPYEFDPDEIDKVMKSFF